MTHRVHEGMRPHVYSTTGIEALPWRLQRERSHPLSTKILHLHVNIGVDTASGQTLIDRAATVATMAPLSSLYTTNPTFKQILDEFIVSATTLATAEKKVSEFEAQLTQARSDRDLAKKACRDCHGAAVKQVEKHSATAADVAGAGFLLQDVRPQGLLPPSGILARFDPGKDVINVHVQYAVRSVRRCVIEISPDPISEASWTRLEGNGVRRTLSGYAAGTWWIRAATTAAKEHSEWFGPVAVVVR